MPLSGALFDAVPDGLIVVDAAGAILMANRRAYAMFGYEPPELIGASIETLVPEEARARHARHRGDYAAHPRERAMGEANMELLGRMRDGRRFPVEIALNPVELPGGRQVLASIRDVSRTRMAQRLLRKAGQDAALLNIGRRIISTGSFADVLQDVTIELAEAADLGPVWLLQLDGSATRFVRSIGATSPPPGWLEAEGGHLYEAVRHGRPVNSTGGGLGRTRLPAGMRSASAFPLLDAEGATAGVLIAMSRTADAFDADVVKLLEATSSLLSAALQREASRETLAHAQRLEAIGQITGGVAHDFNNLLTVIGGNLQLLESDAGLDEEEVSMVVTAMRAVDQGAALTRKLLSFAGRQQLRPAVLELPRAIAGLDRLIRATLGERIRLDTPDPGELPPAYVDPALFDSVVLNLVLNARDAIDGTGTVSIELWTERAVLPRGGDGRVGVDCIAVAVRDTGRGMSRHVLAHAFDPFFTTKGPGRGTGLGLSMVYGFAQQSGGDVRLESRPGHGTSVVLYLPVATEAQRSEAQVPAAPLPGGDEMILLVEDDGAVRRTVRATLRALGYQVVTAASAEGAMQCIATMPEIALLFSDVTLGDSVSGYDLARMARAKRPDIGVLLTSGYPDIVGAHEWGSYALLPKPYHREELARALRRGLETRATPA
jgi:PAS domain S-box-containing protein